MIVSDSGECSSRLSMDFLRRAPLAELQSGSSYSCISANLFFIECILKLMVAAIFAFREFDPPLRALASRMDTFVSSSWTLTSSRACLITEITLFTLLLF